MDRICKPKIRLKSSNLSPPLISNLQHPSPITQHPSPNTQHSSPNTHHPTPNTHHSSPITQHPSPNTHHPSSNIQHPSPITQHPSPIIQHPSPNTHHPTPITQHPSPNTQTKKQPPSLRDEVWRLLCYQIGIMGTIYCVILQGVVCISCTAGIDLTLFVIFLIVSLRNALLTWCVGVAFF